MSELEHEDSITAALHSLTQCLPAVTDSTAAAPPDQLDNGTAPSSQTNAPSALPSEGMLEDGQSFSINGILDSLASAIEQAPQHNQALPASQPASNVNSWPVSQHEERQEEPLAGLGNQLLELQQQLDSLPSSRSRDSQAALKPKSRAAAIAEAVKKLEAEEKAAAEASKDTAAAVVAPAPDFTLLSEQVEQTLHERQAHDHRKKRHRDDNKNQTHGPPPHHHSREARGGQESRATTPRHPPHFPSHLPESSLPVPTATIPLPQPPLAALPAGQLPPSAVRIFPAPQPPPGPPHTAPSALPQVTIIRPTDVHEGVRGAVHILQPGVQIRPLAPPRGDAIMNAAPWGHMHAHTGNNDTHSVPQRSKVEGGHASRPSHPKDQGPRSTSAAQSTEKVSQIKPAARLEPKYRASGMQSAPSSHRSRSNHDQSVTGHDTPRNRHGAGASAANRGGSSGTRPSVHSNNRLKRGTSSAAPSTKPQSTAQPRHRGITSGNTASSPTGARAIPSVGPHRNDKPPGRLQSDTADGKGRSEASLPDRAAGSNRSGRTTPENARPDQVPDKSLAHAMRPANGAAVSGKRGVLEGSKLNRPAGSAMKSEVHSNAGNVKADAAQLKATLQAPSGSAAVLAERKGHLAGTVQKRGADGMGIGNERQQGAVPRDSAAQRGAQETRIHPPKQSVGPNRVKKREQTSLLRTASAVKAAKPLQPDSGAGAAQQPRDKKRVRHVQQGGSSGGHKLPRVDVKAGSGGAQQPSKPERQGGMSMREDAMPKHPSIHKIQRSGQRGSLEDVRKWKTDMPDERARSKTHSSFRTEQGAGPPPPAKQKHDAIAQRAVQMDSSTEEEYSAQAPELSPAPAPETNSLQHVRPRTAGGLPGTAPDAPLSSLPAARNAGRSAQGGYSRQGYACEPTEAPGDVQNLKEWGSEVDKLIADRRAYTGKVSGSGMRAAPSQGALPERTAAAEGFRRSAAAGTVQGTRGGDSGGPRVRAVSTSGGMHDTEAQTEEAEMRSSSAQTPPVWGRSAQCQTDMRGVHQVLRMGTPVTVDRGCQISLKGLSEASEGLSSLQEDTAKATRALQVVEKLLAYADRSQRKQLRSHCRSLALLIAQVSGAADAPDKGDAYEVDDSAHEGLHTDGLQVPERERFPPPPLSHTQAPDARYSGGCNSGGYDATMHEAHADPGMGADDTDYAEQDRSMSVDESLGGEDEGEDVGGLAEGDAGEGQVARGTEDAPSVDETGMHGSVRSEGGSGDLADEDLEAEFEAVFRSTGSGDEGAAGGSDDDASGSPMVDDCEQGEPAAEEESPVAMAAEAHQEAAKRPSYSQPAGARGLFSAAAAVGRPYVPLVGYDEVSDDEILLEASPEAPACADGSAADDRGEPQDLQGDAIAAEGYQQRQEEQRGSAEVGKPDKRTDATDPRVEDQYRRNAPQEEAPDPRAAEQYRRSSPQEDAAEKRAAEQYRRNAPQVGDSRGPVGYSQEQRLTKQVQGRLSSRDTAAAVQRQRVSDGSPAEDNGERRMAREQTPLDAALKAQILGKLSKILPKANLEVATVKRIIKKLEIDLRMELKCHSDFVKHWIDEYLTDASSLASAATAAAAEAAAAASTPVDGDGACATQQQAGAGDSKAAEGADLKDDASEGGGRKGAGMSAAGSLDGNNNNTRAWSGADALSSAAAVPAQAGWDSPVVSTGTPPGTPSEPGISSGKALVRTMHGPGPSAMRGKAGEGTIYVNSRKTAKEKFRSTMTNEQLAEAKAAAAAALG